MKVIKLTKDKNGEIIVTSTGGTFEQLQKCVEIFRESPEQKMYFIIDGDTILYIDKVIKTINF